MPSQSLVARYALAPEAIESRSLAIVDAALGETFADAAERAVATRVLYAAGDPSLVDDLRFAPGAVAAGVAAVARGAAIVVDVRMVLAGIDRARADSLGCELNCAIDDPGVAERAQSAGVTRAVEAIQSLPDRIDGGVVVIGNAPTALLSLLDLCDAGEARPALVIGMPVGFVAAAEAKNELMKRGLPYLTIAGNRGGSPLAAAALNALLRLAVPVATPQDRSCTAVLFAGHGSRAPGAAEAMLAAVEHVRRKAIFPIVETGYLEMTQPDLPSALRTCVEQGAKRVLVVPYFLHHGMHIRRDIPGILRREAENYEGLSISMGRPIGLHADLAHVMIAGALETEGLPDLREEPDALVPAGPGADSDDDE